MNLEQIQLLVIRSRYNYSAKVRNVIEDGWHSEEDIERCITTAKRIYKVERDELKTSINNKKYVIIGKDTYGNPIYTCGKVIKDHEGQLYFFITVHKAD